MRGTTLNRLQCLGVMERDHTNHCKLSIRVTVDLNRKYSYDFELETGEYVIEYQM